MSGKFLARASALSLALILAGCGGDDSSTPLAGSENGGGGGGGDNPTTPDAAVGSIQVLTSSPAIGSAGQDSAIITALVRDKNGVLTSDIGVIFNASNNGSLNVAASTTSEAGQVTAELSTPSSDPKNRTISVTASAGSISSSLDISVIGTSMNLTGPSAISNSGEASYEARLQNSAGQGISGRLVSITSQKNTIKESASLSTDSSGRVRFTLAAQTGGLDTLTVAAYDGESRVTAQLDINVSADSFVFDDTSDQQVEIGAAQPVTVIWSSNGTPVPGKTVQFSSTRGDLSSPTAVTDAQGEATIDISSTSVGIAQITAQAMSSGGNIIDATRNIEFVSSEPHTLSVRASQTQIGTNAETDIIVTVRDSNGNLVKNALVTFNLMDPTGGNVSPGTVRTDSQGRALTTYSSTSSISERDGVVIRASITRSDNTTQDEEIALTVAGKALTLILGTGNTISAANETQYNMPWSVIVTDANGNASTNQSVQLSVLPVTYRQGVYNWNGDAWVPNVTATCATNHSDPVNGETISNPASAPGSISTDEFGSAEFDIRYPKGECTWVKVQLTATSNVEGFSSSYERTFTLPCLADDLTDENTPPPGESLASPYNSNSCN